MKRRRRVVQVLFLLLVVIGVYVMRGDAEAWCPFGGVEAAYSYIAEGSLLCSLGVSNFYILAGTLVSVLLLRRAFCGYACPIGAISELLHAAGRKLGLPAGRVPRGADRFLRLLKYPVLAVILFFTWRTAELVFRGYDPCYAILSRHGEDITIWAYVVLGAIVVASFVITVPFCRWFCPLAAVFHPFSRLGVARVRRDEETCTGCGMCAKACPMAIPVDELVEVKVARCTSCLSCVEACPTKKGSAMSWGPGASRTWSQPFLIGVLLFSLSSGVVATYAWPVPSFVKEVGEAPAEPGVVEMQLDDLTCRGRATLLWYYLERDDLYALDGYLRVEAWPGPGLSRVRVLHDPALTDEAAIHQALTEPYFDTEGDRWRPSPFVIEGYDPFAFLEDE